MRRPVAILGDRSARAAPCSGREVHTDTRTTPKRQIHAHSRRDASTLTPTHAHNAHARMTDPRAHIYTCKSHIYAHILTHARTNALARARTRTYTYTRTRTNKDTHSQTGTSTNKDMRMLSRFSRTERRSGERFPRRSSPLHYAADQGKYDVVRLLVANGADTTARSNANGCVRVESSHRCRGVGCICCRAVAILAL